MSKIQDCIDLIIDTVFKRQKESDVEILSEEEINRIIDKAIAFYEVIEIQQEEVKRTVQSSIKIKMDRGVYLKEYNHKPWYLSFKQSKDSFPFCERYYKYLVSDKGFSPNVIYSLDKATDDIMDMLANPLSQEPFSRRGLIIGDVQSGKTSTYIALINKASDAGYKVIILLTGVIEKLRQQTQRRVDEGFTGMDSASVVEHKQNTFIGVGKCSNKGISAVSLTSISQDFNKLAEQVQAKLQSLQDPVIFVLKKNKTVLEKLEKWLVKLNASNGKIEEPMLLIDDEADAASINTNKEDLDPTAINKCIRTLLKRFKRSNYVAFTATPYANIFINPDTTSEMLNDDLFPRDFIYSLNAPNNYIGASSIFLQSSKDEEVYDAPYGYMLHNNDDCENYIPEQHKKDFIPEELPPSLREAIASFIIINAVRDIREHEKTHRTMLVNVSRFIDVQNRLTELIDRYVKDIEQSIRLYYKLNEDEALRDENIRFLKNTYDKYFVSLEEYCNSISGCIPWIDIQYALYKAVSPIKTASINGGNASKELDYISYSDGLRLIAVGGLSLSRGLTLEGLAVSYYYRNSKMYDTIMQMGRWFGYRPGYEDLCQIWMTKQSKDWYTFIAEASEELRCDIRRMHNMNRTPKDFGLQIRSSNDALLVTAGCKMRSARDHEILVSLSGLYTETVYIDSDKTKNKNNEMLVSNLLMNITDYKAKETDKLALNNLQYLNVPKSIILSFLQQFTFSDYNLFYNDNNEYSVISLLSNVYDGHKELSKWDILVASGDGTSYNINDITINSVVRKFDIKENRSGECVAFCMSGSKKRLGSPGHTKGGLTKQEVLDIESKYKKHNDIKTVPNKEYFSSNVKRNPLLIIYPIELKSDSDNKHLNNTAYAYRDIHLWGIAIGFPTFKDHVSSFISYKINIRKLQEVLLDSDNNLDSDCEDYE